MRNAVRRALAILMGIAVFLAAVLGFAVIFFLLSDAVADRDARFVPDYRREDLTEVLEKTEWTEADYEFLYRQTGLGKPALDALSSDRDLIPSYQEAFFYNGEVVHSSMGITTAHDMLSDYTAPVAPLERGDVIVSSTCHTFGWRHGHAAIVIDPENGIVIESSGPGIDSWHGTVAWFQHASNFIVLRLRGESAEKRASIAKWADDHLFGISYSLTVGLFSPKDPGASPKATNCSHLVWLAFKHFGYDIDSDGGPICTSKDISRSDCFDVVQVFGFDPETLW